MVAVTFGILLCPMLALGFSPPSFVHTHVAPIRSQSSRLSRYPLVEATKQSREHIDSLKKDQNAKESKTLKKGDDTFVLKNVESLLVESPEKQNKPKRSLFGTTNSLDVSKDPIVNELRVMREMVDSCPAIWNYLDALCPDRKAIFDEHLCDNIVDMTYHEVKDAIRCSATSFSSLGIKKGDHVAVFGENSAHWLFVDHGIQQAGGASVVRGADAPVEELRYIYDNSDARDVVVLQNPALLKKLAEAAKTDGMDGIGLLSKHGSAKTAVLMHREGMKDEEVRDLSSSLGVQILFLADLMNRSLPMPDRKLPKLTRDDLATIVYTSGTTGRPKGVMLTHGNLLHQIQLRFAPSKKYDISEPLPGEVMVTILPVWHITERAAELCMFSRACTIVYSSVKNLKSDLAIHKPHWMMLVPRVLEKVADGVKDKFSKKSKLARMMIHFFTLVAMAKNKHLKIANGAVVANKRPNLFKRTLSRLVATMLTPFDALGHRIVWSKVKNVLGGRSKLIVSGGSALSGSVESFYEACGVLLVVGYGLTECSPLICHRRTDCNLVAGGCVGKPVTDTEVRVVDPNPDTWVKDSEREPLEDGKTGLVLTRGPQVMKGYYNNKKATDKSIDKFGWFDTGDLGYINAATGDLFINGRAKDTIVLSNGENIEPSPIEDAILAHTLIDQVVITGQDEKQLSAIVVVSPHELSNKGFLDEKEGDRLQQLVDTINDPHCTKSGYVEASRELAKATKSVATKELIKFLNEDVKHLLKNFRPWEQVGDFIVVLEPFAMVNELLTQSYKIKRGAVIEKFRKSN